MEGRESRCGCPIKRAYRPEKLLGDGSPNFLVVIYSSLLYSVPNLLYNMQRDSS